MRKLILSLTILLSVLILSFFASESVQAAVTAKINNTGVPLGDTSVPNSSVPVGAAYYDVQTWSDIYTAYNNAPAGSTVYLNITGNTTTDNTVWDNSPTLVAGNSSAGVGTVITAGKSVTLIGNGSTLCFAPSSGATSGQNSTSTSAFGFHTTASAVTSATVLTAYNLIINSGYKGGIFQVSSPASPTFQYNNVSTYNYNRYGAQTIQNDLGKILFYGNNSFNIMENAAANANPAASGQFALNGSVFTNNSRTGADNQGEWIQGGAWTEVVTGTTTLNQSWYQDQPFYVTKNTSSNLQVDNGATLVWNLNSTYTVYYDDNNSGPLTWNIGNNASFTINGTSQTSIGNSTSTGNNWFMATNFNTWNVNVGINSQFLISSGGAMNMGSFGDGTTWKFGQGSSVLLNNLNTGTGNTSALVNAGGTNVSQGATYKIQNGITLDGVKVFTMNTNGAPVFASAVATLNTGLGANSGFPITITQTGDGLRTHASGTAWNFSNLKDLTTPNQNALNNADIGIRQNSGVLTGLGTTSLSSTLTPNAYTSNQINAISSAKYLSFYTPLGIWLNNSTVDRNFVVNLGAITGSAWSSNINGTAPQSISWSNDQGQMPYSQVTVTMTANNNPSCTQYSWVTPTGEGTPLELNTAISIVQVDSDTNLPVGTTLNNMNITYTSLFLPNQGLQLQVNRKIIIAQNLSTAASFVYTVSDVPQ